MSNKYNDGKYRISIAGDKKIQNKVVTITDIQGNDALSGSGGGGTDYQSSGDIVKDMIEQGQNFNWAKYVVDLSLLPCFKPESQWPKESTNYEEILAEGYTFVSITLNNTITYYFVVKETGDDPGVSINQDNFIFTDCEPITIEVANPENAIPSIIISKAVTGDHLEYISMFGNIDIEKVSSIYYFSTHDIENPRKNYVGYISEYIHPIG